MHVLSSGAYAYTFCAENPAEVEGGEAIANGQAEQKMSKPSKKGKWECFSFFLKSLIFLFYNFKISEITIGIVTKSRDKIQSSICTQY